MSLLLQEIGIGAEATHRSRWSGRLASLASENAPRGSAESYIAASFGPSLTSAIQKSGGEDRTSPSAFEEGP
jgi:hypothetical protein